MRSAMSACIVSLRKIGLLPREPDNWYCARETIWIAINDNVGLCQDIMEVLTTRFANLMWSKVTPGEATGGLEHGIPSLEQAEKWHAHLVRCGKQQQANCLEAVVGHTVWNAGRATTNPLYAKYRRCGADHETLKHRFWECPANKLIDSDDVRMTETMCELALKEWDNFGTCFFNGGILRSSPGQGSGDCITRRSRRKVRRGLCEGCGG